MKNVMFQSAIFLFALFALTSCEKDDEIVVGESNVMVVHASPNATAVDVLVNNVLALTNLAYPSNSGYVALNSGLTNVKVAPSGTTAYVIDGNVLLEDDESYSVFAIDSVSKLKAVVMMDDLTTPAAGKAHVRFFHFSPNAPAVDIAVAGGPVLFSNRSFNDQATTTSLSNFTALDAGTYNLEVRAAGTNNVVLNLPNITLASGKIYTVFAKGFMGGSGNTALGAEIIVNK